MFVSLNARSRLRKRVADENEGIEFDNVARNRGAAARVQWSE